MGTKKWKPLPILLSVLLAATALPVSAEESAGTAETGEVPGIVCESEKDTVGTGDPGEKKPDTSDTSDQADPENGDTAQSGQDAVGGDTTEEKEMTVTSEPGDVQQTEGSAETPDQTPVVSEDEKPPEPERPEVKISSNYTRIKLKWKKMKGVSGYIVYRKTSKKGKFKKVKELTSASKVSYSDKKVKFNKTYYYRVRPYKKTKGKKKKVYSAYSPVVSAKTKLDTAVVKSAKSTGAASAKITWKKVSGAKGYAVYRSEEKDGAYVSAGKLSRGSKLSYTAKNLKPGVQYYFKVRAYRKSGSKKVYGEYSAPKKMSIPTENRLYFLFPDGVPKNAAEMERYLVTITIPIRSAEGVESTMQLRVHKDLAQKFTSAFVELFRIGFPVRAEDTDTYNWRSMVSGKNRSHHSYGCVVDLNWNSNPMVGVTEGKYAPGVDPYSVTPQVVEIWKKYGFYWGGDWNSSKDYMHFSYTNH